jgi:DNA-binding transcriptional MocR family regulator
VRPSLRCERAGNLETRMDDELFPWSNETLTAFELAQGIRGDILSATVAPGSAMPSRRSLSTTSGISERSVGLAYAQLTKAGLILSTPRSHGVVVGVDPLSEEFAAAVELLADSAVELGIAPADAGAILASAFNRRRSEWEDDPEGWVEMRSEDMYL